MDTKIEINKRFGMPDRRKGYIQKVSIYYTKNTIESIQYQKRIIAFVRGVIIILAPSVFN